MPLVQYPNSDSDTEQYPTKPKTEFEVNPAPIIHNELLPSSSSFSLIHTNQTISQSPLQTAENPFLPSKEKNTYTGTVQKYEINLEQFEQNRISNTTTTSTGIKRKRKNRGDATRPVTYLGPWADYEPIPTAATTTTTETAATETTEPTETAANAPTEPITSTIVTTTVNPLEKYILNPQSKIYINSMYDYQSRSFLHPSFTYTSTHATTSTTINNIPTTTSSTHDPNHSYAPKSLKHSITVSTSPITILKLFPRTKHLFLTSGNDPTIRLYSLKTLQLVREYRGHSKEIRDLCFGSKGEVFGSVGYEGGIKIWHTLSGECLLSIQSGGGKGEREGSGGTGGNKEGSGTSGSKGEGMPTVIQFHPFLNVFLVGYESGLILQYSVPSLTPLTPTTTTTHTTTTTNTTTQTNTTTTTVVEAERTFEYHTSQITSITFCHQGEYVYTSGRDGRIIIWDFEKSVAYKIFEERSMPVVLSACISESQESHSDIHSDIQGDKGDGEFIAFLTSAGGGSTGEILIYGAHKQFFKQHRRKKYSSIGFHTDGLRIQVGFSPDQKYIASGSASSSAVYIWDFETGRVVRELSVNKSGSKSGSGSSKGVCYGVAWVRGSMLLSWGDDGIVRVWD